MNLRKCAAIPRPGDNYFQTKVAKDVPSDFTRIHQAVAVGILQILGNAVTVRVNWNAISIGGDIVITDVHDGIGLLHLISLRGEMIKPDLVGSSVAFIDQR